MAKKRTQPITEPPQLGYILVCDAVTRDPNKKVNHYGVFNRINGDKLPLVARFAVFARLYGGSGKHKVAIELIGPDGKTADSATPTVVEADCKPEGFIELEGDVTIIFSKPGDYYFLVKSGRRTLGRSYPIHVVIAGTPKGKPNVLRKRRGSP
ncbi:MAG: hypothetical protein O3C40_09140 [Planctomycetota bacterium]|nr:hypothetical protein [Planctomycetota bacterium]